MSFYEDISAAKNEYSAAVARRGGVNQAKARLMNTLFNYADEVLAQHEELETLKSEVAALKEENEMLTTTVADLDKELAAAKNSKPAKGAKKEG